MARFDVHRTRTGRLVLDCQSDLLRHLQSRFVVPLLAPTDLPTPARRLNPVFVIDGSQWVMATQFAAAVPARELVERVASLQDEEYAITTALDTLTSGW